jgi:hypothetical protein
MDVCIHRLGGAMLCAPPLPAFGQSASPTTNRTITPAGSTITVTNTFQTLFTNSANRLGCIIQNRGTHPMQVYPDVQANANNTGAQDIPAGAQFTCGLNGMAPGNAFSLTGTAGDAYTVWIWQ